MLVLSQERGKASCTSAYACHYSKLGPEIASKWGSGRRVELHERICVHVYVSCCSLIFVRRSKDAGKSSNYRHT